MSRGALGLFVAMTIALLTVVVTAVTGLSTNAASDMQTWPGSFDIIRRHPWEALLISLVVLSALGIYLVIASRSGPQPASEDDVAGLHERFDILEAGHHADDRMKRLPPYPYELLAQAGRGDRDRVWLAVAPFTDDAVDPWALAREWASAPPAGLSDLPVVGRLVVGELLLCYHQCAAAVEQFRAAVEWGAAPRAYWLVRIAQTIEASQHDPKRDGEEVLIEAEEVDPAYPLVKSLRAYRGAMWTEMLDAMEGWSPQTPWERDTALHFKSVALARLGRLDEAIALMEGGTGETRNPSNLLQLSHLLRARAVRGTGDSRLADAVRAIEFAVRARNLRRIWKGDSPEAVAIAAESALLAEDHQRVWLLTRPAPDGEATTTEAEDPRVLPVAAMGAALTGRITQARILIPAVDGYLRRRIEAEIASASPSQDGDRAAEEAWRAALQVAVTDDEKFHALRGLAMEGAIDESVLDELRGRYPEGISDIELIATIQSTSGIDADERLRALEAKSPLASVRRAELLRHNSPEAAAEVLIDATDRWQHPRLLLLALDCYQDAGMLEQAERVARQALAQYGQTWAGRTTVLHRLADIQSARHDWPGAATTCRTLLEVDPDDEDVRWLLVGVRYRNGDIEEAWQTLNRPAVRPAPMTPMRALLLLDLARRCAPADEVARTALEMLHAFPDNHDVHAAAIRAVTLRADRADVATDVQAEVAEAWKSFFERYPDSKAFTAHSIVDDRNPLAELEPTLRHHAAKYEELLESVRLDGYPVGMLDRVVGKPYSAIFLYRPLGYHRMAFPGQQDKEFELGLARIAITSQCLIDASALYTLALLPDLAPKLLALVARPVITDVAVQDLVDADDLFSVPSSGTLEYDTTLQRVVAHETDPAIAALQQEQIQAMLTTARNLRRIPHPELLELESIRSDREPAWALTLDAAKHEGIALWADDTGLRVAAHSLGIKTFSTHALLTIAHERQRIDAATQNEAVRELLRQHVVDLPYDQNMLLDVAAEQDWQARSVAIVLGRGPTWANRRGALELFLSAFQNSPDTDLKSWAYWAISGIRDGSSTDDHQAVLTSLMVITLLTNPAKSSRTRAFTAALQLVAQETAQAVIQGSLRELWSLIKDAHPVEKAVIVFLHVIGGLDDSHRQYGAQVILEP